MVKKPWQSKTNWVALLVAVLGFVPGVGEFIAARPEVASVIVGLLMAGLRWVSNGRISLE